MDNAVALVQAYLRVNGYFTIAEYPVVEAASKTGHRTLTDIDILAFRFPGAGREVPGARRNTVDAERHEPDPYLGRSGEQTDMIVGEVKEGRATLNRAALDPAVLRAALVRFGCCSPAEAPQVVDGLRRDGEATANSGHRVRMVVFGSTLDERSSDESFTFVPLGHVVGFLQAHLRDHWDLVRHVQTKEPVLGFLLTMEKAIRGRTQES